jgi:hypothetical protein
MDIPRQDMGKIRRKPFPLLSSSAHPLVPGALSCSHVHTARSPDHRGLSRVALVDLEGVDHGEK